MVKTSGTEIYDCRAWLYIQYWLLDKSLDEIAKECNLNNKSPIWNRLKKFKIPTRSQKDVIKLESYRKKLRKANLGNKNPMFGKFKENVSYGGIHWWVKRNKPKPEKCEICNKNVKLELSSKNHIISRNLDDWQWVCHKCHYNHDLEKGLLNRNGKGQFNKVDNPKW